MSERGTGRTTRQMEDAPHGSVFIVQSLAMVDYAKAIAAKIGRPDIEIVGTSALDGYHYFAGREIGGLVIDHDVQSKLTHAQRGIVQWAQTRIRTREKAS